MSLSSQKFGSIALLSAVEDSPNKFLSSESSSALDKLLTFNVMLSKGITKEMLTAPASGLD